MNEHAILVTTHSETTIFRCEYRGIFGEIAQMIKNVSSTSVQLP